MKKYRWLNNKGVVEYRGRANPELRGKCGRCLVFSKPGYIGNVLVELKGIGKIVCPAGCLRMVHADPSLLLSPTTESPRTETSENAKISLKQACSVGAPAP